MNWSFAATSWIVAFGLLLVFAAGWISLQIWKRSGKRKSVARLEALRFILIILLGFTLLRPEVVQTLQRTEQPEIAVLVDRSGSMETPDLRAGTNLLTRESWINSRLEERFWQSLDQNGKVIIEEFGSLSATNSAASTPAGTDLGQALEDALGRERNLKAVLLLTDGDWNTGESPLTAALRYRQQGVPIFGVGVGRDSALPDIALESVSAPSFGLFGEQITIPFSIRSHLSNEVRTTITLTSTNREETRKEIVIPAHGELHDAILWYPRGVGEMDLTLAIPVQEGEALPDNNARNFRISIRVEKLRVLVVDSLPRWEYRYLRNALARDPGVEMNSILFHPQLGMGQGNGYLDQFPDTREAIGKYDVIFLGDVGIGQGELSESQAELIRGAVEQQSTGLVFVPGRRGRQVTFAQSALKDLLPVQFDETRPEGIPLQNEALLTLTAQGEGHLLTRFHAEEEANARIWDNLPGFFWSAGVEKSRPGGEVLAVHSSLRNASGRLPLLVTRPAGTGKVLFLGTDSAWRWRRGVEDKYHYRFWSQVVRWMAHQRHLAGKEGIRLAYSPETPEPGDTIFLRTTILNEAGFPAEEGPVFGTIQSPEGRTEQIQFTPIEGGWGVFRTSFTPETAGRYKVVVDASQHGRKLETELPVQHRVLEKKGQPVNRAILAEIATLTGGTNAGVEGLAEVVNQIAITPEPKPLERRIRLWSSPWWGGAILSLLTVYWVGRKIGGML